jgi:hypothetical protein
MAERVQDEPDRPLAAAPPAVRREARSRSTNDVESVEVVSDAGTSTPAQLANNGFYAEVDDGRPVHLVDGSSDDVPLFPCPLTNPSCAK